MATELQDAADRLANRIPLEPGDREVLVEAARKYDNPDIEAAIEARFNYIDTSRESVTHIVNAALGVTEDEDPLVVTSADGSQTYFHDRTEDE